MDIILKSLEDRIEDLMRAIRDDSRAEIAQLEVEARAKEAEILKAGHQQAEDIRTAILDHARKEAATLREEKMAEVQLNAKMRWLKQREKLLSAVFDGARSRFTDLLNSPEYTLALPGLTKDAIEHLQCDFVILHFDAFSRQLITDKELAEITAETNTTISVSDDLSTGFGVVAQCRDGHRLFDNTLEIRLNRQMESLRAPVFSILMGEEA
jgi:vacuolar-type H+-ATPase subunit E/Vma4